MYKVMVVDDETWGRKSIRRMIHELGLGVEVIAEAAHGQEALELIQVSMPHIVVTDMNMPVMNGKKFLETLYTQYSQICVIVITGYSHFEYLKAAFKYQACEYVLKPVGHSEMRDAMLKAIESCRDYSSIQQRKKYEEDMAKLKREVFFQHVTNRRITNPADIHRQAEELQVSYSKDKCRLAVVMFRQYDEIARIKFHGNADLLMFSLENILVEIMGNERSNAYKSDDRRAFCIMTNSSDSHAESLANSLATFQSAVEMMLNLDVIVGISREFDKLTQLPEAFHSAKAAIERNSLQYSGLSIVFEEEQYAHQEQAMLTEFELKEMRQNFAAGNSAESAGVLNEWLRKIGRRKDATLNQIHRELFRIHEAALTEIKGLDSQQPSLFEDGTIDGIMDITGLQRHIHLLTECVSNRLSNAAESESVRTIQEIAAYLDNHYFEDLSLIDMATRFHLDPSYVSKLFKSVTGENFIEYLTRKRIEKACEMLGSSDRKIIEISQLVGYENQRYFSQVFRKLIGMTPTEYRDQNIKQ